MKLAVTLVLLGVIAAALPAFACDNKECEHNKDTKKSHVHHQKALKEASKPAQTKKTETSTETHTESK
jgi:hypothetical protein